MIEYACTGFLVLSTILWYFLYWRPLNLFKSYIKQFQEKGYKVFAMPFNPLKAPFLEKTLKQHAEGDPFKTAKKQLVGSDIFITNSFYRINLAVLHPDLIKQYVRNQNQFCYIKLKQLSSLMNRGLGKGVFLSQGNTWKKKRKIISQVFTSSFIINMKPRIQNIINLSFKEHQKLSSQKYPQFEKHYKINLKNICEEIFGNVMIECFLGNKNSNEKIQGVKIGSYFCDFQADITIQSLKPLSLALGLKVLNLGLTQEARRINYKNKVLHQWGLNFVKQRVKQQQKILQQNKGTQETDNIVRRFVRHRIENPQICQQYNDQQLYEQFKTFFVSGTDTTNKFCQMMIYYLGKYPQIQSKIREQISQHVKGDQISTSCLSKMSYIDGFQKQVTRIFGPANFSILKQTVKDHYLAGVPIKKGTILMHLSIPTHYSPKYYKNPEQFRPQRWMTGELDNLPLFAHYGFHSGARSCIGKQLALLESKLFLVHFLRRYKNIQIPKNQIKMKLQFVYSPQEMQIQVDGF